MMCLIETINDSHVQVKVQMAWGISNLIFISNSLCFKDPISTLFFLIYWILFLLRPPLRTPMVLLIDSFLLQSNS